MTDDLHIETSPKRVRAFLSGRPVADSTSAKLVWEVPHYPAYYFPRSSVAAGALIENARTADHGSRGTARLFDLRAGDRVVADAAWDYPDGRHAPLRELIRIAWDKMDAWFEEDEEVFVHPHDPYKRIDILHTARHVEVFASGVKIADSRRPTVVFETGAPVRHYMPKTDIRMELLEPSDKRTGCAYKGFARYWRLAGRGGDATDIAWSYATPLPEAAKITGLVAFYDERVEIAVDRG